MKDIMKAIGIYAGLGVGTMVGLGLGGWLWSEVLEGSCDNLKKKVQNKVDKKEKEA